MDNDNKATSSETVESLQKEAEVLKKRLEEERQKLNDVSCMINVFGFILLFKLLCFSGSCS